MFHPDLIPPSKNQIDQKVIYKHFLSMRSGVVFSTRPNTLDFAIRTTLLSKPIGQENPNSTPKVLGQLTDQVRKGQNLKFFFHYCNKFYSESLLNQVILDGNILACNPSYPKMYDIGYSMIQQQEHVFVLK